VITTTPRLRTRPILPHPQALAVKRASARSRAPIRARSKLQGAGGVSTPGFPDRWSAILVGAVNGASIARKTSFLKDRLGEQLFAKNIRIIDDPLRPRGLRSQSFDAEGVKVKKLALIDEGVLTTWLLDCATARELGMVTTGHAHRGVSSSPSPGSYNLHLEAGEVSPAELISDIAQGFYVTDLIGSGVNGVTGDYSRGASGFLDRKWQDHLSGERGHDRGPSSRYLQIAGAGQRPRISLRRQRADTAHRRIDAWRTLAPTA